MAADHISKAQIARIWATAHELGLDRDLLYSLIPRGSISHLSRAEGSVVIEALNALQAGMTLDEARRQVEAEAPRPVPQDAATDEQRHLIHVLFGDLGWLDNPRRATGFLRKYARVGSIDDIRGHGSRRRASAVIEALKAIRARQPQANEVSRRRGLRQGTFTASRRRRHKAANGA